MREVLRLGEQLANKLAEETSAMLAERAMLRDIASTRSRELAVKRDEELDRIDSWAEQQKKLVREVFSTMAAESELDMQKHEEAIRRLNGGLSADSNDRHAHYERQRIRSVYAHAAE